MSLHDTQESSAHTTPTTLARIKLVRIPNEQLDTPPKIIEVHMSQSSQQLQAQPILPTPSVKQRGILNIVNTPLFRITGGLVVGIALLIVGLYFVNLPATLHIIYSRLTTTRGQLMALLASISFVMAFSFRALRWRLFLNPVKRISHVKVIELFLVGVFLNFLLPLRIGELAKSFILKRTENVPISQSLPTITMDKAMDLLPACFIIIMLPFMGLHIDIKFWLVLGLAGAGLCAFLGFLALAAWKYNLAIILLRKLTELLPAKFGSKIEAFAINFIDALLLSAKNPKVFLPALLLTAIGVAFDGLYNMFGFWTIGYTIPLAHAIFGYMLFNLFYILPNPPGQVGSNEVVALLIFTGLLRIPSQSVIAMAIFFHPWSGLLMCFMGMVCLALLGVKLSNVLHIQTEV